MKKVIATCLTLCLSAALALPASALDYTIDAPGDPDYGTDFCGSGPHGGWRGYEE